MSMEGWTALWVGLMLLAAAGFMVMRRRIFDWLDRFEAAEDERARREREAEE